MAWAKTHAYGVYGGRLVFLPAHLGERSGIEIWLDCREKRDGTITFTRFKDNMGKFPLRGHQGSDAVFLGGVFVPLFFFFSSCFLRYYRLTRLSHALWNFQHFFFFNLKLRLAERQAAAIHQTIPGVFYHPSSPTTPLCRPTINMG